MLSTVILWLFLVTSIVLHEVFPILKFYFVTAFYLGLLLSQNVLKLPFCCISQ